MSLTSIYTGISGLNSYGTAMSVIGNNLANVNTVGYKASRVSFADLLSQSLTGSTGQYQVGRGVQVNNIIPSFAQGSFESTNSATDMAIDGDGFFVVSNQSGTYYTRAGEFVFDNEGNLVNSDGLNLQGWALDNRGNINGSMNNINVSAVSSAPNATTTANLTLNLNAGNAIPLVPWDEQNPYNTSNYSTTMSVYDSLGHDHMLTLFFRKTGNNAWDYYALVSGADVGAATAYSQVGTGTLAFTEDGALQTETGAGATAAWANGSAPGVVAFDFGTSLTEDPSSTGLDGTTQFSGDSSTLFQTQNGYASGHLASMSVSEEGRVTGLFSNGNSMAIYQIALAAFESPWELEMVGRNLFAATNDSGQPIIGSAGTSGLGNISSNSLEMSNVDIATEFVNMIRTQQAFQANSRIITTTDQMLQELINLRR